MTLSIFQFQAEKSVRVEFQNDEPLFCLTDVASILEISNANPLRFNMKKDGVHKMYSVDTRGRKNEITYINEPNLYRVIFRSNKPEAVKFQDWIFEEVIPQIRKTGGYQMPNTTPGERTGLRQAVSAVVGKHRIDYSTAYSLIHQRFNVEHIDELTHEQLGEAVAYCHGLILDGGLWGEVLDAPEPAKHNPNMPAIKRAAERMCQYFEQTAPAVQHLNRPIYAAFVEHYKVLKIYTPELA